jgi:hypothetical protein
MIVRETIVAAVLARLQAIPGLAFSDLLPTSAPSDYPALVLDDFGHQLDERESTATHSTYTMTLQVEGFVQGAAGATGASIHAQANALYRSVVVAVLASPDRLGEVAGGVVQTVTEGPLNISVASLATARTVSFTVNFDIQFINRSHDPNLP